MPDDVFGGTFTITNPGPFGTYATLPIINQPQVAILSTDGHQEAAGRRGRTRRRRHHRHPPRRACSSLTWDHRAFDGAYAAAFLRGCATALEQHNWEDELDMMTARRAGSVGCPTGCRPSCSTRCTRAADDYLLLLEHPHVYTLGTTADPAHVLVPPATVGAELVRVDRGGDVTYHGPGQLVGYPIVTLPEWHDGLRDVVAYVRTLEAVLIGALAGFGIDGAPRSDGYTGVWVGDEKIAAIGVKVAAGAPARLRAQRRPRPLDVRPHRPVRHPRPRRHLDGRVAGRRPAMRDGRRRGVARSRRTSVHLGRTPGRRRREPPDDLGAFSRAAMAGGGRRARDGGPAAGPRAPVRLLGRLAAAGVQESVAGPARRRPEWMRVKADLGRRLPRDQAARARPRPAHGVRGGGLPQHLRVLGRPHGHVHDPRRAVHPRVRLLPRRHPQALPLDLDEPGGVADPS